MCWRGATKPARLALSYPSLLSNLQYLSHWLTHNPSLASLWSRCWCLNRRHLPQTHMSHKTTYSAKYVEVVVYTLFCIHYDMGSLRPNHANTLDSFAAQGNEVEISNKRKVTIYENQPYINPSCLDYNPKSFQLFLFTQNDQVLPGALASTVGFTSKKQKTIRYNSQGGSSYGKALTLKEIEK